MAHLHDERHLSALVCHEHELLLGRRSGKIMAVPYTVVGESFRADTPQLWSPTRFGVTACDCRVRPPSGRQAGRDGRGPDQAGGQDQVVFVFNFFDYLRKIAP